MVCPTIINSSNAVTIETSSQDARSENLIDPHYTFNSYKPGRLHIMSRGLELSQLCGYSTFLPKAYIILPYFLKLLRDILQVGISIN